ncbi:MAG: T9SS type A sorting domain-containing protein, partial [candidate division WOR-3 bacterium]
WYDLPGADLEVNAKFQFLTDTSPPRTTLLFPNGGEVWAGGDTHTISWTLRQVSRVDSLRLLLSTDAGVSFPETIATSIPPSESAYQWVVSTENSDRCLVMVEASDSTGSVVASDLSDGHFTIDSDPPDVAQLEYPPDQAMVVEDTVSLIWHAALDSLSGTDIYHAQLAQDSLFTDTVILPSPTTTDTWVLASLPAQGEFYWHVRAKDSAGNWNDWCPAWQFNYFLGLAGKTRSLLRGPKLKVLGPMPFTGSARFVLTLQSHGHVRAEVFDPTGQRVGMLADSRFAAGVHDLSWHAAHASPGVYYLRVRAGDLVVSKRLVLAR